MEKKYQVFVSSTYEDLQEERKKVMEALLQMNCFPVGMEYFNASDSSQWEVIKSLIRECDYYILIVAGRYGSIEEESGKSYTQKEFEYAIEQKVPVISFVHKSPDSISKKYVEMDAEANRLLDTFKADIKKRLCKFWDNADGLASQVILSLTSLIKTNPRIGWVKADEVSSSEANKEILDLRKENELLKKQIDELMDSVPKGTEKLKQGSDMFRFKLYETNRFAGVYDKSIDVELSWNELFGIIAPIMIFESSNTILKSSIVKYSIGKSEIEKGDFSDFTIGDSDFHTIIVQLLALKLITESVRKRRADDHSAYWTLTDYGKSLMMKLKALRK